MRLVALLTRHSQIVLARRQFATGIRGGSVVAFAFDRLVDRFRLASRGMSRAGNRNGQENTVDGRHDARSLLRFLRAPIFSPSMRGTAFYQCGFLCRASLAPERDRALCIHCLSGECALDEIDHDRQSNS